MNGAECGMCGELRCVCRENAARRARRKITSVELTDKQAVFLFDSAESKAVEGDIAREGWAQDMAEELVKMGFMQKTDEEAFWNDGAYYKRTTEGDIWVEAQPECPDDE